MFFKIIFVVFGYFFQKIFCLKIDYKINFEKEHNFSQMIFFPFNNDLLFFYNNNYYVYNISTQNLSHFSIENYLIINFNNKHSNLLQINNTNYCFINEDYYLIFFNLSGNIFFSFNISNFCSKQNYYFLHKREKIVYFSCLNNENEGMLIFYKIISNNINYIKSQIENLLKIDNNYNCLYFDILSNYICVYLNESNSLLFDIVSPFAIKEKEILIEENLEFNCSKIYTIITKKFDIYDLAYVDNYLFVICEIIEENNNKLKLINLRFSLNISKNYNFEIYNILEINNENYYIKNIINLYNQNSFILLLNENKFYVITYTNVIFNNGTLENSTDLKFIINDNFYFVVFQFEDDLENININKIYYIGCKNYSSENCDGINEYNSSELINYNFTKKVFNNQELTDKEIDNFSKIEVLYYSCSRFYYSYQDENNSFKYYYPNETNIFINLDIHYQYFYCRGNIGANSKIIFTYFNNNYKIFAIPSFICEINCHIPSPSAKKCNSYYGISLSNGECINFLSNLDYKYTNNAEKYIIKTIELNYTTFSTYFKNFTYYIQYSYTNVFFNKVVNNTHGWRIKGPNYNYYYIDYHLIYNIYEKTIITLSPECEHIIKENYNITNEKNWLYQRQIDVDNPLHISETYYSFFINNSLVDLSICENEMIYLEFSLESLNIGDYLKICSEFLETYNYNLLDENNDFYNDPCFVYESQTLEIKKKEFYIELTLCNENCVFKNIDYSNGKSFCVCQINKNRKIPKGFDDYFEEEDSNEINENYNNFNLNKNINNNSSKVKKSTGFVLFKCSNLFFNRKIFKNNINFYVNCFCFLLNFGIFLFYYTNTYNEIKKLLEKIIIYYYSYKSKNFSNKNPVISKSSSMSSFQSDISTHSSIISQEIRILNEKENPTSLYKESIEKYCLLIESHNMIFNVIFHNGRLIPISLKISYFLIILQFNIFLQCIYFNDDDIFKIYYSKEKVNSFKFFFKNLFKNSCYCYLFLYIYSIPNFYLSQAYDKFENIIVDIENVKKNKINEKLRNSKIKLTIYFFSNCIINILGLYYSSIFLRLYKKESYLILIGCLVSFFLLFLTSFITMLFLTFLFMIGKFYNNKLILSIVEILS